MPEQVFWQSVKTQMLRQISIFRKRKTIVFFEIITLDPLIYIMYNPDLPLFHWSKNLGLICKVCLFQLFSYTRCQLLELQLEPTDFGLTEGIRPDFPLEYF